MDEVIFASGCYTEKQGHAPNACGEGIILLSFDENKGELKVLSTLGGITNPSYLNWNSSTERLYAVTESSSGDGEIQAFSFNNKNNLILTGKQTGPGKAGCHLYSQADINRLYAASYVDGCLKVYSLDKGEPGLPVFVSKYKGEGPNSARQESPHVHQVIIGPKGHFLYVCDLGSDRIWKHDLMKVNMPVEIALKVPGGYGPRHLAFDHEGEHVFILCELIPKVLVAEISEDDGSFNIIQDLPTVAPEAMDTTAPAAIKVHPSGDSLAVSNRFDDTITIFHIKRTSIDNSLILTFIDTFSSRGKTPRDISFSPSGRWLLIANQDSSDIQVRAFDPLTGLPAIHWGKTLELGTPVCLVPLI